MKKQNNQKKSWLSRLKDGLARTSQGLTKRLGKILQQKKLDDKLIEEIEIELLSADIGPATTNIILDELRAEYFDKNIEVNKIIQHIKKMIKKELEGCSRTFSVDITKKPFITLVIGINGSGKTTTVGKLAHKLTKQGHKVTLCAGDTFRAAAIEQLKHWSNQSDCQLVAHKLGADSSGVVYDSVAISKKNQADVLIIDTAGRLHNKTNLMAELEKIDRVIKKQVLDAPHKVLLVIDATNGQNALNQVEEFQKTLNVSGLIITKLDGTARAGIVIPIVRKFKIPIFFIGVGEDKDDLIEFDSDYFANNLLSSHQ